MSSAHSRSAFGGCLLRSARLGPGIVASQAVRNSSQLPSDRQFLIYQRSQASFVCGKRRIGCQCHLHLQCDAHDDQRPRRRFHQLGLAVDGGSNDWGPGSAVIPGGVVGAKGLVGRAPGGVVDPGGVISPGTVAEPSPDVGINPGVATYHVPPKLASSSPSTCPGGSPLNEWRGQPLKVTSDEPSVAVITATVPPTPPAALGAPLIGGRNSATVRSSPVAWCTRPVRSVPYSGSRACDPCCR